MSKFAAETCSNKPALEGIGPGAGKPEETLPSTNKTVQYIPRAIPPFNPTSIGLLSATRERSLTSLHNRRGSECDKNMTEQTPKSRMCSLTQPHYLAVVDILPGYDVLDEKFDANDAQIPKQILKSAQHSLELSFGDIILGPPELDKSSCHSCINGANRKRG